MNISSPAFAAGSTIPLKFTCDGDDISIPLEWSGVPDNAKSLAIIMDDPDAPMGIWVHWILYNLPPSLCGIPKKQPNTGTLPNGGQQGLNSWRKYGYGGPCPPSGTHRYFFKLYALDCILETKGSFNKKGLTEAMQGHIVEEAQLFGIYLRKR